MESSNINISSEVKVTFSLAFNASFSWLEKPTKTAVALHLALCIILGLLTLSAIIFNICLLLAVFCSSSLKKVLLNQLVSYMSLTCLLDCAINAPFSIYYIRASTWMLGARLCTFNASCMFLITLTIAWILCYMCVERYFSLYKICQDRRCSFFFKQSVAISTLLIILSTIIIPIITGLVDTRAFTSRFSCCVAINNQLYYRIIVIVNFVIPLIVSAISLLFVFAKNFKSIRDINSQRIEMSYTELFFEESHLWNEWQSSKFVGFIFMLFLVFEFPVVITYMKTTVVPLQSAQLNVLHNQNSTIQFSYPIAQVTPSIEKVYFWSKFVFCLAFPLMTLLLRKDIRRKVSIILSLCRIDSSISKNNSIESPVPEEENLDDFLVPQVWRRRRLSSVTSLKSPIIFGKSRNGSLQFMDLTSGIAKWKANYDEKESNVVEKPFFADIFDDEDELDEFVCYEDLTEEELNSSEVTNVTIKSNDVGVQTTQKCLLMETPNETCYNISDETVKNNRVCDSRVKKGGYRPKNLCLSKSFTYNNRRNSNYVKYKYFRTYPKMSPSSEPLTQFPEAFSSSDLLRVLQVKKFNRNGLIACNLMPRGTDELFDSSVVCKDIVSL